MKVTSKFRTKEYRQRIQEKRILCKKFDKKYKRKKALSQLEWRRKKEEKQQSKISTSVTLPANIYNLRRPKTPAIKYFQIKKMKMLNYEKQYEY